AVARRNGDESLPQPQLGRAVGHEALAGLVRGKATCPVFGIERLQRTISLSPREPTLSLFMSKLCVGPTTNRSVGQAPERLRTPEGARKGGAVRRREATAIPVLYRPARRQPGLSSNTKGAHNGKPPDQGRPMQLPP